MISFKTGSGRFNYRVAAVIIDNGKVLLHRAEKDSFWALPGGRCELMEFSEDTIKREIYEEIEEKISVDKLLWVVESTFKYDNENFHELCFIYIQPILKGKSFDIQIILIFFK